MIIELEHGDKLEVDDNATPQQIEEVVDDYHTNDNGFIDASGLVKKNEGGFVASDGSSGAPAIFGINEKFHPEAYKEAKTLADTQGEKAGQDYATSFYKKEYWDKNGIGDLPAKTRSVVFDGAVNHSGAFTTRLIDAAKKGATPDELIDMRRSEYERLAQSNPEKYGQSLQGWENRLNNISKEIAPKEAPPAGETPTPANADAGASPAPEAPKEPGFFERVGADLQNRENQAKEIIGATAKGEQSVGEGALQLAGKVGAGGVLDTIGEGVKSLGKGVAAVTPEAIKKPVGEAMQAVGKNPVVQVGINALRDAGQAYEGFKKDNPRAGRNIDAVTNIAMLASPAKAAPEAKLAQTAVGDAGEAVGRAAATQATAEKQKFVADLVSPKATADVKLDQVGRTTEEGVLKSKVVEPTKAEKEIAAHVAELPVSNKNTLQGNYNIIHDAIETEAKSLEDKLANGKQVVFSRAQFKNHLDATAKTNLEENPLIVGDAIKTADKILAKMNQLADANAATPLGLLKARKQLDAWVKSQKSNVFDAKNESALTIALREIRQTTNDFIGDKIAQPSVQKAALEKVTRESTYKTGILNKKAAALQDSIDANTALAQKQLGVFRKNTLAKVADDTTALDGINKQIAGHERNISKAQADLRRLPAEDISLKDSLKKQSSLYRALDNVAPKAADEGKNAVVRLMQNIGKIIPIKNELARHAAVVGAVGATGAAAALVPAVGATALGAGVLYAGGKALLGSGAKKSLSFILDQTDKAIRLTHDSALISKLRADRASVREMLKLPSVDDQKETPPTIAKGPRTPLSDVLDRVSALKKPEASNPLERLAQ